MKKTSLLLLALISQHLICTAQTTFQKIYSSPYGGMAATCINQTSDGGYILCGILNDTVISADNYLLVKTNELGDTLWTRTFNAGEIEFAYGVQQTEDGGYIVLGYTADQSNSEILLIKTDSLGYVTWSRAHGGSDVDLGLDGQQTTDGGYIIVGSTLSFGTNNFDIYLVKTDVAGNLLWSKTYANANLNYGRSVEQTSDGGYILTGWSENATGTTTSLVLLKTDAAGNMLWIKFFGNVGYSRGIDVHETTDGGYIIAGCTSTQLLYIEDKAILIKTDANGNVQWQQKYFGSGYRIANSVTQTNNGGYAFVGYVLYNFSNVHQLAVCTDSAGNKLWAKTYEATALTDGYSIHETTDGGYIFAGGCAYANSSVNVIKTNANGNSACSTATNVTNASALFLAVVNDTLYEASPPTVQTATLIQTGSGLSVTDPCLPTQVTEIAEINQVNIYPNPASDHFIIDFNKQENVVALLLTDVTGKAVYQSATKNAFYINVNTAYINNGIYLLTIQTEKTTATQKIIVAK